MRLLNRRIPRRLRSLFMGQRLLFRRLCLRQDVRHSLFRSRSRRLRLRLFPVRLLWPVRYRSARTRSGTLMILLIC